MSKLKKAENYLSPEDLRMRLSGCLVRYKGRPVTTSSHNMTLLISDVLTGENAQIKHDDPDLDISSPPLGYVNDDRMSYYVARYPLRRQKQGVNSENTYQRAEGKEELGEEQTLQVHWSGIGECVLNDYPTLSDTLAHLEVIEQAHSRAFHRKFCLIKTSVPGLYQISHMTHRIGLYSKTNQAVISPQYANSEMIGELAEHMEVNVLGAHEVENESS